MTELPSLQQRRIVVALSGGVDSAVAALLLKQAGADVHALHMTNWEDDDGYCEAAQDLQDARAVCEHLDTPLHHVNFAHDYRERVFAHFLDEYRAGRTPNPDVLCNREIKFGVFREYAKRLGAGMLATGHYARLLYGDEGVELHKACDPNKDQTYFLHAVSAGALAETVFPLGDLTKAEVRALARERGLQNHAKKDSTGICFIGERPFREFLANYLPASPGPIQTPDGDTLGEHQGLMYYTIGQRQGLGIGGLRDAGDAPWFVSGKRLHDNVLLVVQGEHPDLYSAALQTGVASWIGEPPGALRRAEPFRCRAKVRYRQPEQRCAVARLAGGRLQVRFDTPQRAVAPGQYVVFYDGDRCLGGAVIERAEALEGPLRAAI